MIIKCTCVHKAQDEFHGKGNRVANETSKTNGSEKEKGKGN